VAVNPVLVGAGAVAAIAVWNSKSKDKPKVDINDPRTPEEKIVDAVMDFNENKSLMTDSFSLASLGLKPSELFAAGTLEGSHAASIQTMQLNLDPHLFAWLFIKAQRKQPFFVKKSSNSQGGKVRDAYLVYDPSNNALGLYAYSEGTGAPALRVGLLANMTKDKTGMIKISDKAVNTLNFNNENWGKVFRTDYRNWSVTEKKRLVNYVEALDMNLYSHAGGSGSSNDTGTGDFAVFNLGADFKNAKGGILALETFKTSHSTLVDIAGENYYVCGSSTKSGKALYDNAGFIFNPVLRSAIWVWGTDVVDISTGMMDLCYLSEDGALANWAASDTMLKAMEEYYNSLPLQELPKGGSMFGTIAFCALCVVAAVASVYGSPAAGAAVYSIGSKTLGVSAQKAFGTSSATKAVDGGLSIMSSVFGGAGSGGAAASAIPSTLGSKFNALSDEDKGQNAHVILSLAQKGMDALNKNPEALKSMTK